LPGEDRRKRSLGRKGRKKWKGEGDEGGMGSKGRVMRQEGRKTGEGGRGEGRWRQKGGGKDRWRARQRKAK